MKAIVVISWFLVIAGCGIGGFILFTGMTAAASAPQEAVVISLAINCAVIPYCWARAWSELQKLEPERKDKPVETDAYKHESLNLTARNRTTMKKLIPFLGSLDRHK